jgi:hypothetical protein
MNRTTSTIVTTACLGVAAGAAYYMMNSDSRAMKSRTRKIKRSTGRALRQVGEFIGNVSYMIR